jgi:hypothetical protein
MKLIARSLAAWLAASGNGTRDQHHQPLLFDDSLAGTRGDESPENSRHGRLSSKQNAHYTKCTKARPPGQQHSA